MDVLAVQTALMAHDCNPGYLDGIWGRRTIAAVKQFQRKKGLSVDGVLGPETSEALFAAVAMSDTGRTSGLSLVWMFEAERLKGTKEVAGRGSNQIILDWANDLDVHYPGDDVPWCGLFTGHCIAATLPEEPLPGNVLGARNWAKFGVETQARMGAVLVFWRGSKDGWRGHVGFYVGEDNVAFHVLGGNQSDSVSIARIAKDRLIGARWPLSAIDQSSAADFRIAAGSLSDDEA